MYLLLNDERNEAQRYFLALRDSYTDEEVYERASKAQTHIRFIKAYLDIGLDFKSVHGVKLERNQEIHIVQNMAKENILYQIQIDAGKNITETTDSTKVQQLKQMLSKILIATQTM